MRGIVAKRIRREVYGDGGSHRYREYSTLKHYKGFVLRSESVVAGRQRAEYQETKRRHTQRRIMLCA